MHQRIDALIEKHAAQKQAKLAPAADDAEFVRRIYLDLTGRIPTIDETRAFLADDSKDKRTKLIDRLLGSAEYPRRMAELFHIMLMERRGDHAEWDKFLRHAFAQNQSWDDIATAILKPDADDESHRGAAFFMTSRLVSEGAMAEVDVPGLTRDVGRLLAGVDLQCAQCHDHLDVEDYKQRDFQGLHMVFENVQSRRDTGFPAISEKLMTKEQEYMSVFVQSPETTSPVVPGGQTIPIVTYEGDEAYSVLPDKKAKQPGEPKFSPLAELAKGLTAKDNELFAANMVNRMWHAMMGRGLIEPLDLIHADNPPSHPELLKLLTSEFTAHDYDLKWLMRELALTKVYGRTSHIGDGETVPDTDTFAVAIERRISAEQLFRNVLVATGELNRHEISWDAPPEEFDTFIADNEELKKLQELFVKTFANPPKEPELEFAPTVKSALFLMHEERVLKLLQPRDGNLTDRLATIEDDNALIDELFLAILSRPPTDEDIADVAKFLSDSEDRAQAIHQVAWALLASTEFCVNH